MPKSSKAQVTTPEITVAANPEQTLMVIRIPNYQAGPMTTDDLASAAMELIHGWKEMDGEAYARGVAAVRNGTKFWDTMRGLRRLDIEQERLRIRQGKAIASVAN